MANLIIGFSKPKKWFEPFSWLIRLVTSSPFSHAYIKFYSQSYDRTLIYQASGLKVNFIGQPMFDSSELTVAEFTIPITDDALESTVQYAIDRCGSSYGILQILGFGAVLFMRTFGKKIQNPLYSGDTYVCSELVSDILIEIGQANGDVIDPSTMSPKDVYDYLISKGFKPN